MKDIEPIDLRGKACPECGGEITDKPVAQLECPCRVYSFLYDAKGRLRLAETIQKEVA